MRKVLRELVDHLTLRELEEDRFEGDSQDLGWGQIFGGQVLAQALSAACRSVPAGRLPHSMHAYFLRLGDVRRPIEYRVDRVRDGRSFTTRRVQAWQGSRNLLVLAASFHQAGDGLDHQVDHEGSPSPEGLLSRRELSLRMPDRLPPALRAMAGAERAIEVRPVDPLDPIAPELRPPRREVWLRAVDSLPDDPALHRVLLTYASDFHFLTAALQPHGVTWVTPGIRMASLDHTIWFHRPFRMDGWLRHVIEAPSLCGGLGLATGRLYTEEGVLVASTTQEGMIRDRRQRTDDRSSYPSTS